MNLTYIDQGNLNNFILNTVYITFIALGIFFNIPSGRFDFSVGSIVVLSSIIGGRLALQLGLESTGLLLMCLIIGAILGAISGLVYISLGLPATVVSLGIALIFEALTFILYSGKGIVLIGKNEMLNIISTQKVVPLALIVIFIVFIIVNFTKFGYNYKALCNGQHIAVNTGINEKLNAVICYALCGALTSLAGVITLSRTGTTSASLGLSSIMVMFSGFLPLFIGGIIAKYSEDVTGIFLGAISSSLLNTGFAALGYSLSVQNIIGAFLLLGFLVYSMNQHKFKEFAEIRKRKKEVSMTS